MKAIDVVNRESFFKVLKAQGKQIIKIEERDCPRMGHYLAVRMFGPFGTRITEKIKIK